MFDDGFFDDFEDLESWFFGGRSKERERSYDAGRAQPNHDVWESNNKIFVTVELPGAEEKDIEYQVSANRLFIGAKGRGPEGRGSYYATIRLPSAVKEKVISKTFRNGVLEIILEKSNGSAQKGQRIEVR